MADHRADTSAPRHAGPGYRGYMANITASELEKIFSRHDPMGIITADAPANEYLPEAETIASKLPEAADVDDVRQILMEGFTVWFGRTAPAPAEVLTEIAEEVWAAATR